MYVRFFAIQWDTDGAEAPGLPSDVVLPVPAATDVALEGADILSDKFGFCVHSFEFELVTA